MATMNISLPDSLREYVEECVTAGGYSTSSEYFRELVREDQKRRAQQRLEELLLEGLESGPGELVTDEWWKKKRQELYARVGRQAPP